MPRKLTLRREQLAELTTFDLVSVAGASGLPCQALEVTFICPSHGCTGYYTTLDAPCTGQ